MVTRYFITHPNRLGFDMPVSCMLPKSYGLTSQSGAVPTFSEGWGFGPSPQPQTAKEESMSEEAKDPQAQSPDKDGGEGGKQAATPDTNAQQAGAAQTPSTPKPGGMEGVVAALIEQNTQLMQFALGMKGDSSGHKVADTSGKPEEGTVKKGGEAKPPGTGGGEGLTMDQVKKMSHAEINKNWDQVKEVLAQGGAN